METLAIILSSISGGALLTALTIPSAIRRAKAQARSAEAAAKLSELDNLQRVANAWQQLADERQEDNKNQTDRIQTLNTKIDQLYTLNSDWRDKYNAKCEENAALKIKTATDQIKLCLVRSCTSRQPQSGY